MAENEDTKVSQSIHPGVEKGVRIHPLVNTCKPYKNVGKGPLGKAMRRLSDRRIAHAQTLKSLPQNVNPSSFRTPGSMNPRKCHPKGRKAR